MQSKETVREEQEVMGYWGNFKAIEPLERNGTQITTFLRRKCSKTLIDAVVTNHAYCYGFILSYLPAIQRRCKQK
jgi:hypothetical protein